VTITTTTRLGLTKDDGTENYSVTRVNANSDKIDAAIGSIMCTSSTRPSSPFTGQTAYETDTLAQIVYTGSTWRYMSTPAVANLTAIQALTPVYNGMTAVSIADGYEYTRVGGVWTKTGSARLDAKYKRTTAQGLSASSNTKHTWNAVVYNNGSIVGESGGVLTLNKTGLWRIDACIEFAIPTAGSTTYAWLGHGANTAVADRYCGENSSNRTSTDMFSFGTDREFTTGDTLALWMWNSSAVGTAVTEMENWVSVRFLG
jgi:hypothetical protein